MKKVTKNDVVENIYEDTGLNITKKDIHVIVDKVFEEIKQALIEDQIVELRGFGTFEVRTRKGREKAHNPKTGEKVSVEVHGAAVFRPGKELKNSVWSLRKD
ncbi:MAG: integration host factor subunit beta [Spirochaetia bacterium]|nr:integration host factor subunit beta [Spirochaetia bacterium]